MKFIYKNHWSIVLLWVMLVVVAIVFGPLALVFSLNVLFKAGIAYGFESWAASLLFGSFCVGVIRNGRS